MRLYQGERDESVTTDVDLTAKVPRAGRGRWDTCGMQTEVVCQVSFDHRLGADSNEPECRGAEAEQGNGIPVSVVCRLRCVVR